MRDDSFLIWSNEHRAWWAVGENGYTRKIEDAGRYPRARAIQIAQRATLGWRNRAIEPPPELAIREVDALESLVSP